MGYQRFGAQERTGLKMHLGETGGLGSGQNLPRAAWEEQDLGQTLRSCLH